MRKIFYSVSKQIGPFPAPRKEKAVQRIWYHSGNTKPRYRRPFSPFLNSVAMQNGTLLQYFHWYYPTDGSLWKNLKAEAPRLAEMGFTAIWLPPASKGTNATYSVGYD